MSLAGRHGAIEAEHAVVHEAERLLLRQPSPSHEDLDRGIKEDVVDGLLGHGADGVEPILACIVDTISERDRELLDELDRLVQEKKRELGRKS